MSLKENSDALIVEPPSQVRFRGPFTRPVVTTVTLINPTDYKIIFKIKTTAPNFYGVRPNFGVVHPRNFTEVEIARQPFNYNKNDKINHKFMVQSLTVPTNVEDLNKVWENSDPTQMNATKLRCVFDMPTSRSESLQLTAPAPKTKQQEQSNQNLSARSTPNPPNESITLNDNDDRESLLPLMPKKILKNSSHFKFESAEAQSQTIKNTETIQPPHQPQLNKQDSIDNFTKRQLDTLNNEMRQLHTENSILRKENHLLKDEIEQVRATPLRHSETQDPSETVPYLYVWTSVSIAVFSIFLGKYIL